MLVVNSWIFISIADLEVQYGKVYCVANFNANCRSNGDRGSSSKLTGFFKYSYNYTDLQRNIGLRR